MATRAGTESPARGATGRNGRRRVGPRRAWWTRARVLAALRAFYRAHGEAPTSTEAWHALVDRSFDRDSRGPARAYPRATPCCATSRLPPGVGRGRHRRRAPTNPGRPTTTGTSRRRRDLHPRGDRVPPGADARRRPPAALRPRAAHLAAVGFDAPPGGARRPATGARAAPVYGPGRAPLLPWQPAASTSTRPICPPPEARGDRPPGITGAPRPPRRTSPAPTGAPAASTRLSRCAHRPALGPAAAAPDP